MKKIHVIAWAAAALFFFAGLSTPVYAFRHGGFCGAGSGFGLQGLRGLDLTADQKKQISTILEKHRPQTDQYMEEFRKLREQGLQSGFAEEYNEEKARLKFREAMPLLENMFVLKAKIGSEIKTVLTEDQVKQLKEKRACWLAKTKERMKCGRAMMKCWLEPDAQ